MFSAPRSATTISSDCFFFFNDPATTEIYTLSLHDALPISLRVRPFTRALLPPRGLLLRLRLARLVGTGSGRPFLDRKSTRLNSSHVSISYAVFCLKKKKLGMRDDRYEASACFLMPVRDSGA